MSIPAVLAPVFVQIALTFLLLVWMGRARVGAVMRREVKAPEIVLGQPAWPPRITLIGNCCHNQLQVPVMFYVLVGFAIVTKKDDLLFVILAWLFVLLRVAHAYVHTGTNNMRHRFNIFGAGVFVLAAMWVIFATRILAGI